MKPGQAGTRSHDDKRNGTTCLMAALDVATGKVIGQMDRRHRSKEFRLDADPDTALHVIVDNQSAHKSAEVHAWLKDHPRWTFHFTPTAASRTSAVEGFFWKLARQRLRNAIFNSLDACIAAIKGYIEHHNANNAHPFRWSKEPEALVASWKRGHQKLQKMASSE